MEKCETGYVRKNNCTTHICTKQAVIIKWGRNKKIRSFKYIWNGYDQIKRSTLYSEFKDGG